MLHCILVEVPEDTEEEDLIDRCRQEALDATEGYSGSVFDWRKGDAGCWADSYPNHGVILGSANPDMFRALLTEWKEQPFRAAQESLERATHISFGHRTAEMLITDGAVCISAPQEDGVCWSAVPIQIPPVGAELLQAAWNSNESWPWFLAGALSLAAGEYRSSSGFYSVPDGSAKISQGTLRDAMKKPEKHALVLLDYHF